MDNSLLFSLSQIETIGDAYCVAGGLHKKMESHAKPIAHMALKMMELSEEVLTPDGKPIKVALHLINMVDQCNYCVATPYCTADAVPLVTNLLLPISVAV